MQSYFVKECKDCTEIESLVADIDERIKTLTRDMLFNKKYLTDRKVDRRLLKDLTYYRNIAVNLQWDSDYYSPEFNRKQIISKIKTLTI